MPQDIFPVSKWKNRINLFPFFNRSFGNDLIDVLCSGGLRAWICGNYGTAFGARLPFFGYAGTALGTEHHSWITRSSTLLFDLALFFLCRRLLVVRFSEGSKRLL